MAVQTPDTGSRFDNVVGSQRQVTARFASVSANDTWPTGLGVITNVQGTAGGTAALLAINATAGVLTFSSTSTAVNVRVNGY